MCLRTQCNSGVRSHMVFINTLFLTLTATIIAGRLTTLILFLVLSRSFLWVYEHIFSSFFGNLLTQPEQLIWHVPRYWAFCVGETWRAHPAYPMKPAPPWDRASWCSDGKRISPECRRPSLTPGLGRSPGVGNGKPLQYSWLENSIDRTAWWAVTMGSQRVRTWMSN